MFSQHRSYDSVASLGLDGSCGTAIGYVFVCYDEVVDSETGAATVATTDAEYRCGE